MPFTTMQPFSPVPTSKPRVVRSRSSARSTAACAAAALSLLGAGGYAAAQSGAGSGDAAAAARVNPPAPMLNQVLSPGALAGFSLLADPATIPTASYWAAGERVPSHQREAARLQRLGFVSGISEQLIRVHPAKAAAMSTAERFRTDAGARAELRHEYANLHGRRTKDFQVVGIPGARGASITNGRSVQLEIMFASGPLYYFVGASGPSRGSGALTRSQLSATAVSLYLTTHGCTSSQPAISPRPTRWL